MNFFLAAPKSTNAPQIIAVAQLLICLVQIYVVVPTLRAMMTPVMTPEDDSSNSSEDELFDDDETDND